MSGGKRFGLTVVIGVCAAVAITAFSHWHTGNNAETHTPGEILEHSVSEDQTSDTTPSESKEIVLQEDMLLSAIQEACADQLTVEELSVTIGDNSVISISGSVKKSDLASLLKTQSDSISSAYLTILDLLPETLPLTFDITLQMQDGAVKIVPNTVQIASMEMPDSLTAELFEVLEKTINRELLKQFNKIDSISSDNGTLIISGT